MSDLKTRLNYRQRLLDARCFIFHENSHLDDAACQWFLKDVVCLKTEIRFQRNDRVDIDPGKGELGLDVIHPHALKGYKLSSGGYSSAFRLVVEALLEPESIEEKALKPMIEWIDAQDASGSASKEITGKHWAQIESVSLAGMFGAYRHRFSDQNDEVCNTEFGRAVLTPLYEQGLAIEKARETVRKNCRLSLDGVVGVCLGSVPAVAQHYPADLLKEMAQARKGQEFRVLYYEDPAMGLGMVRIDDVIRLDQPELVSFVHSTGQGWFVHPGGFLTAYGTKTAPKNPSDLHFLRSDLIALLNRLYQKN